MKQGYDIFRVIAGKVETMQCAVCSAVCIKEENIYGPSNFAAAMARTYKYWDVFTCPHADEPWHKQAVELVTAIENMPSKRIVELMQLDLEELLKANVTDG